jgi:PleD family two-component response regulator
MSISSFISDRLNSNKQTTNNPQTIDPKEKVAHMETKDNVSMSKRSEGDRPSKILLVDDELNNRSLLRDILGNSGYDIVEAETGHLALELAEAESPDTILLDVMMPGMDGFETCRRLKGDDSTSMIPVLMVSALCDRANRIEGISAGAADFITRPIDLRDMLLRVGNAVGGKRLLDEVNQSCKRLQDFEVEREQVMRKIVHDMRSPLGGIRGNLQLLEMVAGEKFTEDESLFLQNSIESVDVLVSQVDLLLGSGNEGEN